MPYAMCVSNTSATTCFLMPDDDLPVYGTMASQFNDPGMNTLFTALMKTVKDKTGVI
jgi:hypothetical protein